MIVITKATTKIDFGILKRVWNSIYDKNNNAMDTCYNDLDCDVLIAWERTKRPVFLPMQHFATIWPTGYVIVGKDLNEIQEYILA